MSLSSVRAAPSLWWGALVVTGVVTAAVMPGCPTAIGPTDAGTDEEEFPIISCAEAADCPGAVPECSFGVCKRPCAANEGCIDPRTFCNATSGYCEPGCRSSGDCTSGKVCSGGSCIESQGCATKCDCEVGQVCVAGACQEPPATCQGTDDCPKAPGPQCEDFACNGFTRLCFDPDPEPCNGDADCVGRPGCAQGCACTSNGQCVPGVDCTEQNEASTCGAGNYCDGNGTCQVLPGCTAEGDCAAFGLTCNIGAGQCVRARSCTSSADCTTAPATHCNLGTGFCAQPLCNNGGITCPQGQSCDSTGRCVSGSGASCTNDTNCAPTEYCAVVSGGGQCVVGCRNNASCPAGQQCDATRTCVGGTVGRFGDPCTGDEDCQAGLLCGALTGTCAEPCSNPGSTCAGGACCPLSGAPCCRAVLFFGFCGDC
jgi:hypothetical protein